MQIKWIKAQINKKGFAGWIKGIKLLTTDSGFHTFFIKIVN